VDDMVDGIVRFMATPTEFLGPINLGNPVEFSIRQLAETVLELTGSQSSLVFKSLPSDDPKQRRPDISLARRRLGWEPAVTLNDGLLKTIEYFEQLLLEKGK
ncbi:MAG: SDR family NAD-dependent epimerase/dehydratase, partial [Methylococcales bacterium]|nr:SDR family NAD-dependent epimerase/dehydratase [Methylococcales bacterium]